MPNTDIVTKSRELAARHLRSAECPWPPCTGSAGHDRPSRPDAQPSFSHPTGWIGDCVARVLRRVLSVLTVLLLSVPCYAEISVDSLYDFRHFTDPKNNANNFPVVELKVFIPQSFGTFLMKEEIDLEGPNHNVSQVYTELSQSLKLGRLTLGELPLLAHFGYSGGLGVFGNGSGGFYTPNAYNVGLEYRFEVQKAFCDASLALRDTNFAHSSYGPMVTVYAGRYFLNYKLLVANSLEAWTTPGTLNSGSNLSRASTFASWELESEVWYKIAQRFSVGTYVRTTRNVYALSNRWVLYPSFGMRYAF